MMQGRPAKPDGQKVNRNPSLKPLVVLPAAGRSGPVPLPPLDLGEPARALWARMWRLPQATRWSEGDLAPLCRLVVLQADPDRWGSALGEIRQLEDRFGLNPEARQRLGWVLDDDPLAATVVDPPASVTAIGERRARVQVT